MRAARFFAASFKRAEPHVVEAGRRSGINTPYEVFSKTNEGVQHYMLSPEQVERIELAGLDAVQVAARLHELQDAATSKGLTVFGYMPAVGRWIMNFRAGPVMLEPNPYADLTPGTQFRLWYTSWDGARRRDVTEMSDEEFVAFMAAEPELLKELKF